MPIYEYQCEECTKEFEDLILAGCSEPDTCPQCGSHRITRLVSTFGFVGGSAGGAKSACASCSSGRCNTCNV
jgi:putative FmdB family regulatory protein